MGQSHQSARIACRIETERDHGMKECSAVRSQDTWLRFFGRPRVRRLRASDQLQSRLLRFLLILPEPNRSEDPARGIGLLSECFEGSAPSQIVRQALGGDAMEAIHPFLVSAVIS